MREILRKLQKNHRKGYTLAELLIVIVITGILASFGFVEVAKSQRKLKRTEMDNTAREIFVAAQNHLTASQTSGAWEAAYFIDGEVSLKSTTYQGAIGYELKDYPTTDNVSDKSHAYYYVIYNQTSEYENALTDQNSALTKMLPYGSVDDTIRKYGSYIIEFDAKTESIYGVFYTDKGTITRDDLDNLTNVRTDATARETFKLTSDGKTYQVGYYGGATAKKNEVNHLVNPTVTIYNDGRTGYDASGNAIYPTTATDPYYEDVNKNALVAVIKDPSYTSSKNTELTITVTQVSNGTSTAANTASFTIEAPSQKVNDASNGSLTIGAYSNVDKTALQDLISKGLIFTKALDPNDKDYDRSKDNGIVYYISLDDIAGDLDSSSIWKTHFADLFTTITPGSDISVKATLKYGSEAPVEDAKTANSLFDSINNISTSYVVQNTATGNYQANILTGRHLANLSKDISGYDGAANFKILSAKLLGSIDWKEYITNKKTPTNVTYVNARSVVDNLAFPTIYNSTLTYFNGNNQKLSNFNVAQHVGTFDKNQVAGIGGMFNQIGASSFTIENVDLVDFNVSSSIEAGSLIGRVDKPVTITNVHAYNSSADTYGIRTDTDTAKYGVKSKSYCVGGLVGVTTANMTITNSSASVMVVGDVANAERRYISAGGLVGYINGGTTTITDSYVGGKVLDKTEYDDLATNANVSGYYSGGFIGSINNSSATTVNNSYTTASVYGQSSAGGFIGYEFANKSNNLLLSNIYCTGDVDGGTVGLFAGTLTYKSSMLVTSGYCYTLSGISDVTNIAGNSAKYTNISTVSAPTLSNARTTGTTGTADPYDDTELSTSYPYPTTASKLHHGDWIYPDGTKRVTLTKNIVLPAGTYKADQESTILQEILDNTYIEFTDLDNSSGTQRYPFNMDGISIIKNSDGYTLSIPAYMNTADKYNITEHSNSDLISMFNSFAVSYSYTTKTKSGNVVNGTGKTGVGTGSGTDVTIAPTGGIKFNSNQKFEVTFTNTYQQVGPSFMYFEKYSTGNTYMHGYSGTNEIGDKNLFPTDQTTKVVDDGYLLVVPNADYAKVAAYTTPYYILPETAMYVTFNGSQWSKYSIYSLESSGGVEELSTEDIQQLGLSDCHVYRLKPDDMYNTLGTSFNGLWSNVGYSTITFSDFNHKVNFGDYYWNTYYADSVSSESVSGGTTSPTNTLRPIVRSASQMSRIITHNGLVTCNTWGNTSGLGITQLLNIDMSDEPAGTITNNLEATYQGIAFPGTNVYPKISGLKQALFKYVNGDGTIQNLNVQTDFDSMSLSISDNYGTFIIQNQGNVNHVNFVDNIVNNCTIGYPYSLSTFGIIGQNSNATLSDIQITNTKWTNSYFRATSVGFLGKIDASCDVSNITITGSELTGNTLIADDTGLIATLSGSASGITTANNTFNSNTITAKNFGNIANVGGSLSNVTMTGTTWNNGTKITATNAGLIGYILNNKVTNGVTFDTTTWDNVVLGNGNYGLIGRIEDGEGSILNSITIKNTTWSNITGTPTYLGVLGNIGGITTINSNGTSPMIVDTVNFTNVNVTTDHFGIFAAFNGNSTGLSINKVIWEGLNITPASNAWKSFDTWSTYSNTAIVPDIKSGKTFTATSITNVSIHNLNANATFTGIIGNVAGTIDGLTVSDIHMYNDQNSTSKLTGQFCGLIGTNSGTIHNLQLTKGTTYGLTMENLNLNTRYWGAVGKNSGTIDHSKFNDVTIANINSSTAVTTLSASDAAYGLVGDNEGTLNYNDYSNTSISSIVLPVSTEQNPVYFGVIGWNHIGKITNAAGTESAIVINNVSVTKIFAGDANTPMTNYGFIGTNECSDWSNTSSVHDLTVTNFTEDGYGIAYQNLSSSGNTSTTYIQAVSISMKDLGTAATGNNIIMVYNNTGYIMNNTLKAKGLTAQNGTVFSIGTGKGDKTTNQFLPLS